MDNGYETALLRVADAYAAEAEAGGGKSLARVATIVVNRGSFFERLREGGGCSSRNLARMAGYFRDATNWPGEIPVAAIEALASLGCPAKVSSDAVDPGCASPGNTHDLSTGVAS